MFNTNQTNDWNELAQSVADGEAVLVLGPDAIPLYRIGAAPENAHDEPAEATFSQLAQRRICAWFLFYKDSLSMVPQVAGQLEGEIVPQLAAQFQNINNEQFMFFTLVPWGHHRII